MSRHTFFPSEDDSCNVVVVGWDKSLKTFFFQYGDPGSDLPLDLATGQRPKEHSDPGIVVWLANYFGEGIPENLADILLDERREESGAITPDPNLSDEFLITTQAYNGSEIGFKVPRHQIIADPTFLSRAVEHILNCDTRDLIDR